MSSVRPCLRSLCAVAALCLGCSGAAPAKSAGPALPPAVNEKLQVASSVCAAAISDEGGRVKVGCRSCPPFDGSSGPDGRVENVVAGRGEFYELEALFRGSFSRPGSTEAAAVFSGCESHADNWGGTLLVERVQGAWAAKSYRSGFRPDDCKTFRPADRDVLVCRWQTTHQEHAHWMIDTYDFAAGSAEEPEKGWEHVLALDDDSVAACTLGDPSAPLVADTLDDFRLEPGGRLVVEARTFHGEPPEEYRTRCAEVVRAIKEDHPSSVNLYGALRARKQRLVFTWTGTAFVPDAATRSVIER